MTEVNREIKNGLTDLVVDEEVIVVIVAASA